MADAAAPAMEGLCGWPLARPSPSALTRRKVHGSLARAGKVRGQTPKVAKQDKKKKPKGRAHKRQQYNSRFVTAGTRLCGTALSLCASAFSLPTLADASSLASSSCASLGWSSHCRRPLPSQLQSHLLPRCLAFSAVVCLGIPCLPLPCPPGPRSRLQYHSCRIMRVGK
eukprot:SM000307S11687  [mRNA]  locus=s307:111925:112441:+ [translate_table: standard]